MKCKIDGCDRDVMYKAAQLCQKHYFRIMRNGTANLVRSRKYRTQNPAGYQKLFEPLHPLTDSAGYVYEHRKIIYDKYGISLPDCEICGASTSWDTCHIDHKDNDPTNNNTTNLRPLCPACNTNRGTLHGIDKWNAKAVTLDGVTLTPHEWGMVDGVKVHGATIRRRLSLGASAYDAIYGEKKTHNGKKYVAPRKTQFKHQRKNAIRIIIDGELKTASEWAQHPDCKVCVNAIVNRVKAGWDHKLAVFNPPNGKRTQGHKRDVPTESERFGAIMGYTSDPNASHEPMTLVQTPENVKAVRLRAGFMIFELSLESGIDQHNIFMAENGKKPMTDHDWRIILTVCGRRVFDKE